MGDKKEVSGIDIVYLERLHVLGIEFLNISVKLLIRPQFELNTFCEKYPLKTP